MADEWEEARQQFASGWDGIDPEGAANLAVDIIKNERPTLEYNGGFLIWVHQSHAEGGFMFAEFPIVFSSLETLIDEWTAIYCGTEPNHIKELQDAAAQLRSLADKIESQIGDPNG